MVRRSQRGGVSTSTLGVTWVALTLVLTAFPTLRHLVPAALDSVAGNEADAATGYTAARDSFALALASMLVIDGLMALGRRALENGLLWRVFAPFVQAALVTAVWVTDPATLDAATGRAAWGVDVVVGVVALLINVPLLSKRAGLTRRLVRHGQRSHRNARGRSSGRPARR